MLAPHLAGKPGDARPPANPAAPRRRIRRHPAAGNPGVNRPSSPPELIGVDTVAEMLGVSPRHVRRLTDEGRCPQPFRLGKCCRWSRRVIDGWIADGCPRIRTHRAGRGA